MSSPAELGPRHYAVSSSIPLASSFLIAYHSVTTHLSRRHSVGPGLGRKSRSHGRLFHVKRSDSLVQTIWPFMLEAARGRIRDESTSCALPDAPRLPKNSDRPERIGNSHSGQSRSGSKARTRPSTTSIMYPSARNGADQVGLNDMPLRVLQMMTWWLCSDGSSSKSRWTDTSASLKGAAHATEKIVD